jgi:endonuclease/exonuclease/phosphatase family metal-dependent hydrolase
MDESGVQRIAAALNAGYVYYPATEHPRTHRNFGNAVISRWPIEADRKIMLPHFASVGSTQRIAVGATLRVGSQDVRVYSVHLATLFGNGPTARREQLERVLADADSFPTVIIAGDFNSETVPQVAFDHGYAWPTRSLPHTNGFWTFDHVLIKGMPGAALAQAGTPVSSHGASDHRPVWAILNLPPAAPPAVANHTH